MQITTTYLMQKIGELTVLRETEAAQLRERIRELEEENKKLQRKGRKEQEDEADG